VNYASWVTTSAPDSREAEASMVEAARRDPAAFAALYRRYVTPVYRYLYSRVGNVADAEDLTAQVFTEVLAGLERYREQGSFSAWLFAIAHRKAIDHFRARRQVVPLHEEVDPPLPEVAPLACLVEEETLQKLAGLVARLSQDEQELLRLRFAAGLTYGDMAVILRRSEAAVKMAMHRLLARLKTRWKEVNDG
jgi:RNA polymerase sigma-70 factor (ECF subfamily)